MSRWCGPCLMPRRSTSMVPRLLISPCKRARNLRRVGPSWLEVERLGRLGLRLQQESGDLRQVHAVLAVVVVGVAADPAGAGGGRPLGRLAGQQRVAGVASQRRADQPFEAALAGV